MKTKAREITKEEFEAAYNAAPPEIRREVRRLLAEDCRNKGDYEAAERISQIQD